MKLLRLSFIMLITAMMVILPLSAQEATEDPMEDAVPRPEITEVAQFDTQGYARFGHFVSDVGAVDIYLDDELVAETVEYGVISDWFVLATGGHNIVVTLTGESIDNAVLASTLDVRQDNWVTVGITGTAESISNVLIEQAIYTELPTTAQVTFANVLATGEGVDFTRDDVIFIANTPVITADLEVQNSIPTDARLFTYGALGQTQELDVVDTSSYLILAIGTADNPQLIIDETPLWEINFLTGDLPAPATLYQALQTEPLAAPFLVAVEQAGLVDMLSDINAEAMTIFVPADYVMDDVDLTREDLAEILRYHIVVGDLKAGDLFLQTATLTTIDGDTLSLSQTEQGFINGAQIIDVNHPAANGTIHIINAVLMPAE